MHCYAYTIKFYHVKYNAYWFISDGLMKLIPLYDFHFQSDVTFAALMMASGIFSMICSVYSASFCWEITRYNVWLLHTFFMVWYLWQWYNNNISIFIKCSYLEHLLGLYPIIGYIIKAGTLTAEKVYGLDRFQITHCWSIWLCAYLALLFWNKDDIKYFLGLFKVCYIWRVLTV